MEGLTKITIERKGLGSRGVANEAIGVLVKSSGKSERSFKEGI
jgi:hypothetical protein